MLLHSISIALSRLLRQLNQAASLFCLTDRWPCAGPRPEFQMYHVQPMLAGDSSCATPRPRMCCREGGDPSEVGSSIYLRVSEENNGGQLHRQSGG